MNNIRCRLRIELETKQPGSARKVRDGEGKMADQRVVAPVNSTPQIPTYRARPKTMPMHRAARQRTPTMEPTNKASNHEESGDADAETVQSAPDEKESYEFNLGVCSNRSSKATPTLETLLLAYAETTAIEPSSTHSNPKCTEREESACSNQHSGLSSAYLPHFGP